MTLQSPGHTIYSQEGVLEVLVQHGHGVQSDVVLDAVAVRGAVADLILGGVHLELLEVVVVLGEAADLREIACPWPCNRVQVGEAVATLAHLPRAALEDAVPVAVIGETL